MAEAPDKAAQIASSPVPRAVLDTSVLLSEHRHWLWLLARRGLYEGVWSAFIVGELARIRTELSIRRGTDRGIYRKRINDLIHALSDVLRIIDYRHVTTGAMLNDPDDEPILATATACRAAFIVSLNTRDFPEGDTISGVHFVTPRQFLDVLTSSGGMAPSDPSAMVSSAGRQVP